MCIKILSLHFVDYKNSMIYFINENLPRVSVAICYSDYVLSKRLTVLTKKWE